MTPAELRETARRLLALAEAMEGKDLRVGHRPPALGLSTRSAHALWRHFGEQEYTPETVAGLSQIEFLRIPNVGLRSLAEVRRWLAAHGLEFKRDY